MLNITLTVMRKNNIYINLIVFHSDLYMVYVNVLNDKDQRI